jgi:hypothetical protein
MTSVASFGWTRLPPVICLDQPGPFSRRKRLPTNRTPNCWSQASMMLDDRNERPGAMFAD